MGNNDAVNILSFDVEDWYMSYDSSQISVELWPEMEGRIVQNIGDILDFLAIHNTKATFYIMGWVAERHRDVVVRIGDEGHEIGYHSYYHQLPVNQGPEAFERDLAEGLGLLRGISKQEVVHYRAPRFSMGEATGWCVPILKRHGITVSSSTMGGRAVHGVVLPQRPFFMEHDGVRLLELPLNRAQSLGVHWVFTGSGYFRLLPLRLIKRLYGQSDYNMAYFHPRDFDVDAPSTSLLPFYRNWMSRMGNKSTMPKLDALLRIGEFCSVGDAAAAFLLKEEEMERVRF